MLIVRAYISVEKEPQLGRKQLHGNEIMALIYKRM